MGEAANPHAATLSSDEVSPVLLAERYEVCGLLGAGAMGTVYRALDRELNETVALKVLKKELASAEMLERFRREVKLARRVTHRNVARTFDIGEHGGDRFLTMEFVEGELLSSLLARNGKLGVGEVVRIALELCAGLEAAHEASVLHRDLKPENVMIAKDGRAVITDFGIARIVARGELSSTMGGIVGTPAYMAPEQVEGASDLDARTDLYALGTMLFELATGRMAWLGDSIVTVAAGRLLRPPPDVRSVDPHLPPDFAEIVLKLMARKKDDRFPSATATAAALSTIESSLAVPGVSRASSSGTARMPAPPRPAAGGRSVAVLPVLNLGGSDDAYLVDGMNEDVIDLLSVVPGLLIRPRGDTASFATASRDVRAIGRALEVDVVVDASFRRIGDAVRASFRVITVEDGFQLWARRFDRTPAQVLSIADDAAHAIAQALTSELKVPVRTRPTDPESEDLYLRARYLLRRGWTTSMQEAAELLGRASERAPDDARILGGYALSLARTWGFELRGREIEEKARVVATRALELDPAQPEAQCALATLHLQRGEPQTAARHFGSALVTAPNCVEAIDWLGRIMTEAGKVEDGLRMLARAVAIDPVCFGARHQIARVRGLLEGRAAFLESLGPLPSHPDDAASWLIVRAREALWRRDHQVAREVHAMLPTIKLADSARFALGSLVAVTLGDSGRLANDADLDRVLPVDSSRPPRRAAFNAQIRFELFMSIHDHPRAFEALKAADSNGLFDVFFLDSCPLFDPVRAHPEFVGVQSRVRERAKRLLAALA
jgi:serine/threonine-protein kinase